MAKFMSNDSLSDNIILMHSLDKERGGNNISSCYSLFGFLFVLVSIALTTFVIYYIIKDNSKQSSEDKSTKNVENSEEVKNHQGRERISSLRPDLYKNLTRNTNVKEKGLFPSFLDLFNKGDSSKTMNTASESNISIRGGDEVLMFFNRKHLKLTYNNLDECGYGLHPESFSLQPKSKIFFINSEYAYILDNPDKVVFNYDNKLHTLILDNKKLLPEEETIYSYVYTLK